jgi:hypothetical protein
VAVGSGIVILNDSNGSNGGVGSGSNQPNPEVVDVEQDGEQVEYGVVRWDFTITVENSGGSGDVRVVVSYPRGNIEREKVVSMAAEEQRQVRIENVVVSSQEADGGRDIFAEPIQ